MIDGHNSLTQLPQGWVWTILGEISSLGAGNPAPQGEEYFDNDTYPFVRVQDMGSLGNVVHIYDTRDHLNNKAVEKLRLFPKGSVLFTKSGMSILLNQRAILGRDMYVVSHVGIAIPLGGIPSEYLYYWLKTIDFKDLTHATTLPSLRLSKVQEIRILLPPLPEQHRIVAKIEELFTRLDAGVQALKKIKAQLSRYRQAVLKHAFEGKLTEEWRETHKKQMEPASVLLKRIREERRRNAKGNVRELPPLNTADLPELPEGWVWTRLGEVGEINSGYGFPKKYQGRKEGEIPFFKVMDISKAFLNHSIYLKDADNYISVKERDEIKAEILKAGTTVFAKIGEAIKLNRRAILSQDSLVDNNVMGIYPFPSLIDVQFIFYLLLTIKLGDFSRATTVPSVRKSDIEQIPVPFPSLAEQRKIVEEIDRCFSVADAIEKDVRQSLEQAERLRQSILKRAFESKLVPQDPTDEPAEKLLEHIRAERARIKAEKKATGKTRRS